MTEHPTTPRALRIFAKFVAASTLFLIFAGAMVTSTDSGLAVPDWPLSYGKLMPPMVGGIFYEHGHRMIAAFVGFLTVLQAIFLQLREPKRFVRVLGWCAVGAVIAQGTLGGLTVLFLLPPAISISHAALAELFLCINMSIAFFTSKTYSNVARDRHTVLSPVAAKTLVVLVYVQILLGALMRHIGAGLAIPDFPLSFGSLLPPFTSGAIISAFSHRVGALLVTLMVIYCMTRGLRSAVPQIRRLTLLLALVVAAQVTLGAWTVWSAKNPVITSLHVVTGASTLATSLLLALTTSVAAGRIRSHVALSGRAVVA